MPSGLVLVRTVSGLERLTAEEVVAAGHRVVDESKAAVGCRVGCDSWVARRGWRDDLFVVHGAVDGSWADQGRSGCGGSGSGSTAGRVGLRLR